MADIPTSGLPSTSNLNTGDLLNVSVDQGGGSYVSNKISLADFDMVHGRRYYGAIASDPVTPTPNGGDRYFNTGLNMEMYYDSGRSKWFSVETYVIPFGRTAGTGAGVYYRYINGLAFSATNGLIAPYDGTVIGIGYTRNDTDAATFEVVANGSTISGATLASSANSGKTTSIDSDFSEDDIIAVRNQAGGNTTSAVHGWVRVKWRSS